MTDSKVPTRLLTDPGHFLSLGCGAGLLKPAPGTWGTLLATLFWWTLLTELNLWDYVLFLVASASLGVWLCGRTAKALETEDHPAIVWDEFVGLWIACLALPAGWMWILVALLLFRLFDIFKPWPVGILDRKIKGGLGIMLDDLAAGLMAFLVIQIAVWIPLATGTISPQ